MTEGQYYHLQNGNNYNKEDNRNHLHGILATTDVLGVGPPIDRQSWQHCASQYLLHKRRPGAGEGVSGEGPSCWDGGGEEGGGGTG